jgi:hypothetical protein
VLGSFLALVLDVLCDVRKKGALVLYGLHLFFCAYGSLRPSLSFCAVKKNVGPVYLKQLQRQYHRIPIHSITVPQSSPAVSHFFLPTRGFVLGQVKNTNLLPPSHKASCTEGVAITNLVLWCKRIRHNIYDVDGELLIAESDYD